MVALLCFVSCSVAARSAGAGWRTIGSKDGESHRTSQQSSSDKNMHRVKTVISLSSYSQNYLFLTPKAGRQSASSAFVQK